MLSGHDVASHVYLNSKTWRSLEQIIRSEWNVTEELLLKPQHRVWRKQRTVTHMSISVHVKHGSIFLLGALQWWWQKDGLRCSLRTNIMSLSGPGGDNIYEESWKIKLKGICRDRKSQNPGVQSPSCHVTPTNVRASDCCQRRFNKLVWKVMSRKYLSNLMLWSLSRNRIPTV